MGIVPNYDIIGINDNLYCRAIEILIEKGYSKYCNKETDLIIECATPNTMTVLRDGTQTTMDDMEYNSFSLEDEEGEMIIVMFNAIYGSEVFANIAMGMADILASQLMDDINPLLIKNYSETIELIAFSLSSYLAIDMLQEIQMYGQANILKEKFNIIENCYDKLIEDTEETTDYKVECILELIGLNYLNGLNKLKTMREQLNSSHLTVKTVEKLQESLFKVFKNLINKKDIEISLVEDIECYITTLYHII